MRAQRPVPVGPRGEGVVVLELPLDRQVPHRVAPCGRGRCSPCGPHERLVQPGRARDDVRAREGERLVDERAQLCAPGRSREEAAGQETRAEVEFGANRLSWKAYICSQMLAMEGGGEKRTAWAEGTYFSKNASHDGSSSMIIEPLRAATKSTAGCIDVRAAVVFRSGVTWISDEPYMYAPSMSVYGQCKQQK